MSVVVWITSMANALYTYIKQKGLHSNGDIINDLEGQWYSCYIMMVGELSKVTFIIIFINTPCSGSRNSKATHDTEEFK